MKSCLALLVLAACGPTANRAAAPPANQSNDVSGPPYVVLSLAQDACWGGDCPVYDLTLSSDGTLVWKGTSAVATVGEARATVPLDQVQRVIDILRDGRFLDIDDDGNVKTEHTHCTALPNGDKECETSLVMGVVCSDTSHTHITFHDRGQSATFEDMHCVDTDLSRMEQRVLDALGVVRWIGPALRSRG